ncbi:MAG: SpoIID/LytB domain-containing protein [Candidatus Limnocylindrales bacterium]
MNRQPRAVGSRVVRLPVLAIVVVAALLASVPAVALGRGPSDRSVDLPVPGRPWSADAVELAHTAPEAILAGTQNESCTGWRSTFEPPPTIRVLRSRGPNKGFVEVVPFADYVPQVMPSEWPAYYPIEALKAGAVQVKMYGWYFTIVYRGGKTALGDCYDVKDTSADQNYNPQRQTVYPVQRKAVELTWDLTLRRFRPSLNRSDFLLAEYRTGYKTVCGLDADGKRLYQRSVLRCAHKGMSAEQILRLYLEPRLEIVNAGFHDIVGDASGDASVMVREGDVKSPRLFSPEDPDALRAADVGGPLLAADSLLGVRSVDVDRNGWDDLLTLQATVKGWELDIARSDGTAYGLPERWASGNGALPQGSVLLAGDFDADGDADAAILVPGLDVATDPENPVPIGTLRVFHNDKTAFRAPVDWWTGPLDMASAKVFAAEANGDGRTDLIVMHDLGEAGLTYDVAPSHPRGGSLLALTPWYVAPDLRAATTRTVVGDYNRDGRDDLWVITPSGLNTAVSVLRAEKTSVFSMVPRWTSTDADGVVFGSLRVGSADVNFDGLGDLVFYLERGLVGTRLVTLRGLYAQMMLGPVLDDATLDWNKTSPY